MLAAFIASRAIVFIAEESSLLSIRDCPPIWVRFCHIAKSFGTSFGTWKKLALVSTLESRFSKFEFQFSTLESRISILDSRLSILESRISTLDSRISTLDSRLSTLGLNPYSRFSNLDYRISILDSRIRLSGANLSWICLSAWV